MVKNITIAALDAYVLRFAWKRRRRQGEGKAIIMIKPRTKARCILCICCVAVLALSMGWFASRFVPAAPREPAAAANATHRQPSSTSSVRPDRTLDTAFGEPMVIEGVTQGKAYRRRDFDDAQWAHVPDEVKPYIEAGLPVCTVKAHEGGDFSAHLAIADDLPAFQLEIVETRAVSASSFADFYPAYRAAPDYDPNRTVVLVDAKATNLSSETSLMLPNIRLWTAHFVYADDADDNATAPDTYLLGSLYPSKAENVGQVSNGFNEAWNMLAAGETRTITLPYLVSADDLADARILQGPDFADWCVQTFDYDPPTSYRFWLAPPGLE